MVDDPSLITAARGGDQRGYAALYRHHHRRALHEAEKVVANRADAQDAVAAAFASTFLAIRKGGGPDKAFTPYLMAAVRNAALQIVRTKRYSSEVVTEDAGAALTHMDVYEIGADPAVRDAFQDLPVRWREVLWKTEIEGTPARALSDEMQMSPASIAALAKRARDGFRAAYLASALGTDPHEWAIARLDLLREGALDARTRDLVELHVEHCAICQGELAPLPVPMASIGVILLVGGAVQPVGGVGAAVAGSALLAKLRHLRSRTIDRMSTQLATVSAATVAIAGTLLVVAISARSPSSSPASGAVPTVESMSSGASATTATAGSVRLPGGASDGSPPGTDVGSARGTGAGSTPTVSAESSPPNVPGPPPRGGAVTTPHGPTTSVTTAGSTVVIAPGSTPGATTSGATTTITGGLPGTTATVAGAPFIPPASTAPGATTAPGPVILAPPVAPTTSSTTTGPST
ncbi:MAG: hypothetical protein JWM12_1953, partial [Ilumatobacteraceae bacterium]|nr:hypothetical protein [Ilumatobacteraceae bacterium]